MRITLLGFLVFASLPARAAVTGSVDGTLTDAQTGAPLADVRVEVDGATATTDARGAFVIDGLSPGAHAIAFRDPAGLTLTQAVDVPPEGAERVDLALSFGAEIVRILEKAPAPPATRPLLEQGATVSRLPRSDALIESNRAATVWVMATVDAAGAVADARVMKSAPGLGVDGIAVAEARGLRFFPAMDAEGKPTLAHVLVKVEWDPYWSRLNP